MNLRWFVSKTVRSAGAMRKHVHKILSAQRDLLSPQAITAVETAMADVQAAAGGSNDEALNKQMAKLEEIANKWLKPYPNAAIRENVEVLLVALAVALGIRTFFVQPFKYPTGSMQPTLMGVNPGPDDQYGLPAPRNQDDLKIPGVFDRFFEYWIEGYSYFNIVAPENGRLEWLKPPSHLLLFNLKQEYQFNGTWHTVWFPADDLFRRVGYRSDPTTGKVFNSPEFKTGDAVLRLRVTAGDHLFVDRLTYNFRHPKRGEIIVFETKGIQEDMRSRWGIPPDEFYIKRLVVLGGEHVQIGDDRHLIINGHRLDKNSDPPHFENVYGFDPKSPPEESHYSGHVYSFNGQETAPIFTAARRDNPGDGGVTVPPDHYMVMGDNTMNSLDSRFWGAIPEQYVIGKYFFVYWPFSKRFGWDVK